MRLSPLAFSVDALEQAYQEEQQLPGMTFDVGLVVGTLAKCIVVANALARCTAHGASKSLSLGAAAMGLALTLLYLRLFDHNGFRKNWKVRFPPQDPPNPHPQRHSGLEVVLTPL
jgi:hypothetical protein